jgi:regulator of sigma E protease
MEIIRNIAAFLLVIPIIVIVHEFGHFFFARLFKVKVEAFSIGFGKELWARVDKKGTRWKICAIPLGGYVRLFGQADMPQEEAKELKKSKTLSEEKKKVHFEYKKLHQKALIVLGGPLFNFIFSFIVFATIYASIGQVEILNVVGDVMEGTPAHSANIKKGDKIASVNGIETKTFDEVSKQIKKSKKEEITLQILRNGMSIKKTLTPIQENKTRIIGIKASTEHTVTKDISFISAVSLSGQEVYKISKSILVAIYQILTNQRSSSELGGIISIVDYSGEALATGLLGFMLFLALISTNLGVINLLPVPVLDGGHLMFYLMEAIMRRPLSDKMKEKMLYIGAFIILGLIALTFYNDIARLLN